MSLLGTIVRKELEQQLAAKSSLAVGALLSIFFGFSYSQRSGTITAQSSFLSNGLVFYLSLSLTVFLSYSLTTQAFIREKTDRVIETLLCSPTNLRELWLGKVLAAAIPVFVIVLLGIATLLAVLAGQNGRFIAPGGPTILYIFTGLPMLILAALGIVSFVQFMLGMRENRIINLIIFLPIFILVFGVGFSYGGRMDLGWTTSFLILALVIVLFSVTFYLTRFLSKERIVTSIT